MPPHTSTRTRTPTHIHVFMHAFCAQDRCIGRPPLTLTLVAIARMAAKNTVESGVCGVVGCILHENHSGVCVFEYLSRTRHRVPISDAPILDAVAVDDDVFIGTKRTASEVTTTVTTVRAPTESAVSPTWRQPPPPRAAATNWSHPFVHTEELRDEHEAAKRRRMCDSLERDRERKDARDKERRDVSAQAIVEKKRRKAQCLIMAAEKAAEAAEDAKAANAEALSAVTDAWHIFATLYNSLTQCTLLLQAQQRAVDNAATGDDAALLQDTAQIAYSAVFIMEKKAHYALFAARTASSTWSKKNEAMANAISAAKAAAAAVDGA